MNQPSTGSERRVVLLLSGPNLDILGSRQPEIYGRETLDQHVKAASDTASELGLQLEHLQSNHEGDLVDAVSAARGRVSAIIVNAGALTHYSRSIADALAAFDGPVVELHLSNPFAREPWRSDSVISPVADGLICGFGQLGYRLAAQAAAHLLEGTD